MKFLAVPRGWWLAGVVPVAALLATGCPAPRPADSSLPLRLVLEAGPVTMDPHLSSDFHTTNVLGQVYEGLTLLDASLRVKPALATSWETPNETTWIFHLRPGVQFHNGRALTAEDVAFSLRRAQELPGSDIAGYLSAVKSVQALDPATVEIDASQPSATLLSKLAFVSIVPADSPSHILWPVGTGPYWVEEIHPGQRIELHAFAHYWQGPASEQEVSLRFVPDEAERVRRLLAGEADIVSGLAPEDVARVNAVPGCRATALEGLTVNYIQLRVDRPPFSDVRVRQAVNLAIDRNALVEDVYRGQARPTAQMLTANDVGYAPDIAVPRRDVATARRLLAEAGYGGGLDLELEYRAGGRPMVEIQRQLADAGIRATLRARRWEDLYPRLLAGQASFLVVSVLAESGDASDILDSALHSRGTKAGFGESNVSGYSNPELDRLIELADRTLDPLARRQQLQDAIRILSQDMPYIPLLVPFDLYGARAGLDWQPRVDSLVLAYDIRRPHASL